MLGKIILIGSITNSNTIHVKEIHLFFIYSPLAQILDSKSMEDLAREITDVPEVFDVLNAAFVATFGCDLSHISALFTLAYANAGNLSQTTVI